MRRSPGVIDAVIAWRIARLRYVALLAAAGSNPYLQNTRPARPLPRPPRSRRPQPALRREPMPP
jgi:hypothetical protein